ncbi:MAG: radical SAM protein [Clostridia bacterium]|nr:radical SAM protein [Clostridia bacterium]
MKNSVIPIFIPHLGCPNACVFCNQRRIAQERAPETHEVKSIIEEALKTSDKPQVSFYGGSFTAIDPSLQEEYLSAAYMFYKAGLIDSVRLSTRPDAIDESVIARLKKYGVKTVELGVQSMDDRVLSLSKRGHTAADCERAANALKAAGFEVILQIMPGLPGASRENDLETAKRVAALSPAGVRIYPVCVIRDTELCDMYERGEYKPLTCDEAADLCADIFDVFVEKNIPVVRIGLNPTEELSGGAAVAGAYHPAMGQLVRSAWLFKKVCALLDVQNAKKAVITVPAGRLSDMRGQKNLNVKKLKERYPETEIEIREDKELKAPFAVKII